MVVQASEQGRGSPLAYPPGTWDTASSGKLSSNIILNNKVTTFTVSTPLPAHPSEKKEKASLKGEKY